MLTSEQQFYEIIKNNNNFLITFGKSWRGDAVASALGLYLLLKKLDKNIEIIAEKHDNGNLFSFLPAFNDIKNSFEDLKKTIVSLNIERTKAKKIKYKIENNKLNFYISPIGGYFTEKDISFSSGKFKYDIIIILGTPDLESLGSIYENQSEFFYNTPIINIDNNPANESFGHINLVELTSSSSSEIIFNLFSNYNRNLIDANIASCLLAGIITETKSFKIPNISPNTLSIAAQLISLGAEREKIINKLYRSKKLNIIKLWGKILTKLSSTYNNKLIWSILSSNEYDKNEMKDENINEIIDELIINIPQAKIIIIIYEEEINGAKNTNAVIYTTRNIDSFFLLKEFKPKGTKNLAKIIVKKDVFESSFEIINNIEKKIKNLPF